MNEEAVYSDSGESSNGPTAIDVKLSIVTIRLTRFILAHSVSQNTIISRDKLLKTLRELYKEENCRPVGFATIFEQVNQMLSDTYGYEFRGIEAKSKTNKVKAHDNNGSGTQVGGESAMTSVTDTASASLGAKATHFILLNKLLYMSHFENFKLDQTIALYNDTIDQDEYVGDDMSRGNVNTLESRLGVDQEMALQGITCLFICIILFSNNNILHQEIIVYLNKFGIPVDGTEIPIIGMSLDDFIKHIEKKEYIVRLEEKPTGNDAASNTVGITLYRIGRRTKYEFDVSSLVQMLEQMMGITVDSTLLEDIKKSVADAYD
ncbi:similar to Saccharomyces cerevisiae YDR288W NSE3 Essential subunit of the Mms21-Smc5-Smc6 complex [Maudiozyma barnettii]|uniref:Similar to Saccharomyces cerevisiae YDR288W NSE3 Essential subunit of the Mms21-Smc5-Smc6 complex n=1 Tax=Maudiozyma barnettii TaxID=61262 RepID=A0A8H2VGD9_9SACH|nr:Smc5-Smc6 complex subunit NSE3 [Kazachstania barnettii]CAB4254946.1 similar to Saccharomyces cerevisiae YDR288W NSE3 Essential subunit of the Mms21-Smc5-Smc6 complex [Kazachstania barnettii]CAD1783217.1 similar to Saccharomyces cerevisiae YDR288W NSE3 Essential subunit of the Mms21-Smc5-Smc6 complex [Kazachstania barnettii]